MEAALLHYYIPNMVSERVRQVRLKLLQVADHLFTRTTNFHSGDLYRGPEDSPVQGGQPSGDSFSSTSYFFVSNYIAAHFPELTESALVLSYRDPLPPDTLRKNGCSRTRVALGEHEGIRP